MSDSWKRNDTTVHVSISSFRDHRCPKCVPCWLVGFVGVRGPWWWFVTMGRTAYITHQFKLIDIRTGCSVN